MEKNGTPASPATARASSVLPVPGRAVEQDALRDPRAERLELLRVLEELLDLVELLDRLVAPATSRKVIFGESTSAAWPWTCRTA
jgi:hypothetical protein